MIGLDTTFVVAAVHKEHPRHAEAVELLDSWQESGEEFALCTHVVAEFLHVVTDSRRFENPMPMSTALDRADALILDSSCSWLNTTDAIVSVAMSWIRELNLGRKRILDTFIAATYASADIEFLATLNPRGFDISNCYIFCLLPTTDAAHI